MFVRWYCLFCLLFFGTKTFAYETCYSHNNYLEVLLPDVVEEAPSLLPIECVEAAHLSLPVSGYYGFCPSPEGQPARTHPRPCVSRKYVGNIHSAIHNVTDCLDYDPRLAFATFNLESALHMNAVGAAVDVGIGQLTRTAIEEVTLNALDRARRLAAASPKESCKKILPYMTPHSSDKAKRCGFMSVPENPVRNVVYSILLIQQNRKAVDRYWSRLNIQMPDRVNAEHVKEHLTHLAYNAGSAGTVASMAAYAEIMGLDRLNERLLNFESKDFYSFPNYMARYYPVPAGQESTRKRISKYVMYVAQAARRAERLAGRACVDPDTFPLPDPNVPVVFASAPDFASAPARIEQKLRTLANEFVRENKSKDCRAKRAQFEHEFLPNGASVKDLPPYLAEIYDGMCAG